jgi:type II secretory pathway component PulJ
MHRVARIEIVWRRLFAMNRMLRRSCYKQMNAEEKVRELLEVSPSDCEPNSDTDSETSVESGSSVPCDDSGEGRSVPDQFVTP